MVNIPALTKRSFLRCLNFLTNPVGTGAVECLFSPMKLVKMRLHRIGLYTLYSSNLKS